MFAVCDVAITQLTSKTSFGGLRPARITGSLEMNCFRRQDTERTPFWVYGRRQTRVLRAFKVHIHSQSGCGGGGWA